MDRRKAGRANLSELLARTSVRHYHRKDDFKIVKQRDDLVSAFRYACMMKRHGKPLSECDGIGYGVMPYAGQRRASAGPQIEGVDFDPFTGR